MRITARDTVVITASPLVPRRYLVKPPRVFDGGRDAAWSLDAALTKGQEMAAAHKKATGQELQVAVESVHAADGNRFVDVRK